jgi:hypothetical protein
LTRHISVIATGINEWTGLSGNTFSAIRKLQPEASKPPVYIVHFPYLIQRKLSDTRTILKKMKWRQPSHDKFVDTGGSACLLARACEAKAERMLGFHLDSSRLAREVTVGFLTKRQAQQALTMYKQTKATVKEVLIKANILED